MQEALKEAYIAFHDGEVPIGSLIVSRNGEIISSAHNQVEETNNPVAHAEMLAIQKASNTLANSRLSNCILISTLEPCIMCAGAISLSRLEGVVFGAWNPDLGAFNSKYEWLSLPIQNKKIWYFGGIYQTHCSTILNKFFLFHRN